MKQVEIEDKKIFDKYQTREIMNSEYRFTTVFAWAHKYHFKYIENKNVLYIFGNQNNGDLQCYFPLGQEIKKETIDYIAELFEKFKQPFNLRPLSKEMVEIGIPFLNIKVIIGSKLSYRDYIYDYSLLCEYSGHGYKKKRKAVNKFYSSYNYAYISINKINCKEALSALNRIVFQLQDAGDKDEWDAYTRILNNFEALKLKGGMILIDGRIEGIAVAEAYHETIYIHIRRCNKKYSGIYPAMLQLLLKNEFGDQKYKFVNLQDDMGIENIRKAKLSYRPIRLLDKYYIQEEKTSDDNTCSRNAI